MGRLSNVLMGSLVEYIPELLLTQQTTQKSKIFPFNLHLSNKNTFRVLLATIRNMGKCPCPCCLMDKSLFKHVGTVNDMKFHKNNPRVDSIERQSKVKKAWLLVYSKGKKVDSKPIDSLLLSQSMVPTQVCPGNQY